MKKYILSLLIVLIWCSNSFGAATPVNATEKVTVWRKGVIVEVFTYTDSDTVEQGTPEIFKIPARNKQGRIVEVSFLSSSTDCETLLSQVDDLEAPTNDTKIHMRNKPETFFSPELRPSRVYTNGDTPQTAHLYLTIINNDSSNPTSDWVYTLVYERY